MSEYERWIAAQGKQTPSRFCLSGDVYHGEELVARGDPGLSD